MKLNRLKIIVLFCVASILMLYGYAEARTALHGEAGLSYTDYDAKWDSRDASTGESVEKKFSGSSLAQQYSVLWTDSNLIYRSQPRYYDVSLGYNWLSFDTKVADGAQNTRIQETLGKYMYSGQVGYNPVDLPIRLTAYANNSQPYIAFQKNINQAPLLEDNLVYNIDGNKGKNGAYGVSFTFEPDMARAITLRGLPRLDLDYRESFSKLLFGVVHVDTVTKELSAASLSKNNNIINYRTLSFEDNRDSRNNFTQQQIQLGLVNNRGLRLWSSLTNWIDVSADGELTSRRSNPGSTDEYDVNFMAVATRRTWNARTFMNYNRLSSSADRSLTETARVPIYVKGVYGTETDWYLRLSAERGRQTLFASQPTSDTSYSNTVVLGANTFTRSRFILAPSISVTTNKGFGGADALNLTFALETNSTGRFSNKVGLGARAATQYIDNGSNSSTSRTLVNRLDLSADYRPDSKFRYRLKENFEAGEGAPSIPAPEVTGNENYFKSLTTGTVLWTPNAEFTASLDVSYFMRKNEFTPEETDMQVKHILSYNLKETSYRIDSTYRQNESAANSSWSFTSSGEFMYRPDRYSDALLRYTYIKSNANLITSSSADLLERYSYNFFTRNGVIRNLATLSQEFGYSMLESLGQNRYNYYASISGRYSPIARLSLSGSVKYQYDNSGSTTLCYNAGLSADFKLLSTSIDYALAKRDSDNRIEKRLSAAVSRTF